MIDENVIEGLREYLKDHYVPDQEILVCREIDIAYGKRLSASVKFRNISDDASAYIKNNKKLGGFAHALDRKRKEKGLKPADLYKKANIDRRHYSRLMVPEGRHPSMNTVISFSLALGLERHEFDELLQTAGYALSNTSSRDVCIMYCLEKGIYNIDDVNTLLFSIGIEPLTRDVG